MGRGASTMVSSFDYTGSQLWISLKSFGDKGDQVSGWPNKIICSARDRLLQFWKYHLNRS